MPDRLKNIHLINVILLFSFFSFAFLFCIIGVQAQSLATSDQVSSPEVGLWATKENDGVFQIYSCGQALCGRFVGMQYTTPLPPKSKQGHSQCNFLMLRDFTLDQSGKYWRGKIFDPRDEKGYDAKIWLSNINELKVRGYLGISLFGETHVWHRFQGTILQNCLLPNSGSNHIDF